MTLALGLAALAIVVLFVAWMVRCERRYWQRTREQIRALPTYLGERVRK